MRLPKSRGFKRHFKLVNHTVAINIGILNTDDRIAAGSVVTVEMLTELGYGKRGHGFKVLGNGELSKKLTIQGLPVSATAQEAIQKAGGSVE